MQILLQALFAETLGKRPSVPDAVGEDGAQDVFAEFFFSEGGSEEFDDGNFMVEDVLAAPVARSKPSQLPHEIEILLPELGQPKVQPDIGSDQRMIDITPDATAPKDGPMVTEDMEEKVLPVVASIPATLPSSAVDAVPADSNKAVEIPKPLVPIQVPLPGDYESRERGSVRPREGTDQRLLPEMRLLQATDAPDAVTRPSPVSKPDVALQASRGIEATSPLHKSAEIHTETAPENQQQRVGPGPELSRLKMLRPMPQAPAVTMHENPKRVKFDMRPNGHDASDGDTTPKTQTVPAQPAGMAMPSAGTAPPVFQSPSIEKHLIREPAISMDPATGLLARESDDSRPQSPAASRPEVAAARPVVSQVIQMALRANLDGLIEVRLQPEELGRVRLAMTQFDTGVTVHITAERQETLDLLRRNIDMLENDLREQGFEHPKFSFGKDGADTSEQRDDMHMPNEPEPETNQLQVDIISDPALGDGRLDIRL